MGRRERPLSASWATPVVVSATALPLVAASGAPPRLVCRFAVLHHPEPGRDATVLLLLGNTGATDYPAGATFEFSVPPAEPGVPPRVTSPDPAHSRGMSATPIPASVDSAVPLWRVRLLRPVPAHTGCGPGAFPLTNPLMAFTVGAGESGCRLVVAQTSGSPGTTPDQGLGLGREHDSRAVGCWIPAPGHTYPTGATLVTRSPRRADDDGAPGDLDRESHSQ